MLEAIERANLFLVPLDEERRWWRDHHLFADLLRTRLEHELPERAPHLHRAAAAWHEEHGFASDALRHAVAAGEVAWAGRLVERHAEALLLRSEGATLDRWLGALPAEVLRARPRLCLARTITAVFAGRVEAAEPLLADAERAFSSTQMSRTCHRCARRRAFCRTSPRRSRCCMPILPATWRRPSRGHVRAAGPDRDCARDTDLLDHYWHVQRQEQAFKDTDRWARHAHRQAIHALWLSGSSILLAVIALLTG
jgi:hypothetical protein